jgi:hypothetical protein
VAYICRVGTQGDSEGQSSLYLVQMLFKLTRGSLEGTPKFPCNIFKGDHFLRDYPGLPKVLEMFSSISSNPIEHASDTPSTSDVKVGKKNRTAKFHFMLCEGDHYSHLFPCMDEDYYILENIQFSTGYHKISPKSSLLDGLVNPIPSPVSLVD